MGQAAASLNEVSYFHSVRVPYSAILPQGNDEEHSSIRLIGPDEIHSSLLIRYSKVLHRIERNISPVEILKEQIIAEPTMLRAEDFDDLLVSLPSLNLRIGVVEEYAEPGAWIHAPKIGHY